MCSEKFGEIAGYSENLKSSPVTNLSHTVTAQCFCFNGYKEIISYYLSTVQEQYKD